MTFSIAGRCAHTGAFGVAIATSSIAVGARCAHVRAGVGAVASQNITDPSLGPLLLDLAELYGAVAEERGQALVTAIPDSLPAYGDREMLQQAVANLLDNALKFSPPGGTIRLEAGPDAGQGIRIVVADQGPGIPPEDRARATERFFRGETARNTPGSGLGLALVQAVAALHGGALRLDDNAPGVRATMTLTTRQTPGRVNTSSSPDQRPVAPALA